jgi:hypothetical protein
VVGWQRLVAEIVVVFGLQSGLKQSTTVKKKPKNMQIKIYLIISDKEREQSKVKQSFFSSRTTLVD